MESLIDRRTLRRMAGARAFERGEDYCAGGQVQALGEHEDVITAKVLGTREYRVKLWVENGEIAFPVEEVTIAGNLTDMLARIQMVGSDLEFRSALAAPTILVDGVTVAGI